MMVRIACVLTLVCMLACGTAAAEADDGAFVRLWGPAPGGTWTMRGGSPSGAGRTDTRGLRDPVKQAWRIELGGSAARIEGEPRVWKDRIVLAVEDSAGERSLHVRDLSDGSEITKPKRFKTSAPLEPCVWGDLILVRESPSMLGAYRIGAGSLELIWRQQAKAGFHSPILAGRWVYALDGEDVVGWHIGGVLRWRTRASYRGRIAASGSIVVALKTDDIGNLSVAALDRMSGVERGSQFCGGYQQRGKPGPGVLVDTCLYGSDVLMLHHQALRTGSGGRSYASHTNVFDFDDGRLRLHDRGLPYHLRLPVMLKEGWLTIESSKKRGPTLLITAPSKDPKKKGETVVWPLAHAKRHARLAEVKTPYAVAGDVVYIGGFAFDAESRRILWSTGLAPLQRPVPADEAVLYVTGPRELQAWRAGQSLLTKPLWFGAAQAVGTKEQAAPLATTGLALLRDGSHHEGAISVAADGSALTVEVKKGKKVTQKKVPIAKVDVLLDGEDRLLYARAPRYLQRPIERFHFMRQAKDYEKLAREAYKTYDAKLMARLIAGASARGISDKKLKHPRKQQKALVDRPRKANAKRRDKLLAKLKVLEEDVRTRLAAAVSSPIEDPRWPVRREWLRPTLERSPSHPRASALVKERMPKWLPPPDPFRGGDWLDLVDQFSQFEVKRIERPDGERRDLSREEREYGSALATWRKDLAAIQSEELLILTPLASPSRIAGCLSMGTLVCNALEEVFKDGKAVRKDPWPMILQLFETQAEYLAHAERGGKKDRLEWTGGHYDPNAGVSRIFLPKGRDAWASVIDTYAHELKHHWIRERCPLFESRDSRHLGGQPGYWIVEGMATFVEEFQWDVTNRTWNTQNPRAGSLDIVASAKSSQLHPWRMIFNASTVAFWRLDRSNPRHEVPMQWRLGYHHRVSDSGLFYAQASAACHYLYHAGEKERKQLLDYVRRYYTGKLPPRTETAQEHFGMSPEALGQRVVSHARKVSKPK